jgi:hypothetical protein
MILDVLKGVFVTLEAPEDEKKKLTSHQFHHDYVCVITPPPSWATCR